MRTESEQVLCRFYLTNLARIHGESLYEWIVRTARREGLQGATVLKGLPGWGPGSAPPKGRLFALAHEVPVIVEVVDGPKAIERLLARIEPELREGMITLERAFVPLDRSVPEADARVHAADVASARASTASEVKTMSLPEEGVLLRIFIGEADRQPGGDRPLYEALVLRAREAHLAGATVLKGPLGFGKHSRLHSAKLLELSSDLPVVVEIVDSEERITAFLPMVDELVSEGLVTLEAVRVLKYTARPRAC